MTAEEVMQSFDLGMLEEREFQHMQGPENQGWRPLNL